jgi:N-ethylmaleimide reductase
MSGLFSALRIGALELPNRIIMAPMTRNRAPHTLPNALLADYYAQRASAGLMISEGAQISSQGIGYPNTPGIHSAAQIAGWRTVTERVHALGGRLFCQLWHCGRISHPSLNDGETPVAPSAIRPQGQSMTFEGLQDFVTPRALAADEIRGIVADYAHAAHAAREAGFDGVEIHAANGYLIDQFLRDGTNQRTDTYGGSLENRARFLLEVTAAVCEMLGADRVGLRLSPFNPFNDIRDSAPATTFGYVAQQLNRFGLGYLHITEMDGGAPGAAGPGFDPALLRQAWNGVLITNGGYDKARAEAAIRAGAADAVAFGVPYIANPDLVERLRADAALNAADSATFYGGDAHGYTDYPSL